MGLQHGPDCLAFYGCRLSAVRREAGETWLVKDEEKRQTGWMKDRKKIEELKVENLEK